MDPIARMVAAGAAGAGGGDPTYVDDVFSTFLYDGTGSTQSINNGIDLAGEGGFVWIKRRSAGSHTLYDTERGATQALYITSDVESARPGGLTSFNSNGFTVGDYSDENASGNDVCSWTFRKAPGFFDIVTYTGSGSAQNISHNLGSVPGMIIIKNRSNAEQWQVWHRSITGNLELDNTGAINASSVRVDSVTSTSFRLTSGWNTSNANSQTYVAYIFGHNDQSFGTNSDEAIIKCDSYTGASAHNIPLEVNVGFEPQWVLIKNTGNSSLGWVIFDTMRGWTGATEGSAATQWFQANSSDAESGGTFGHLTPTGFVVNNSSYVNGGSNTFIYMAIRRPHKPPTAGTEVFAVNTRSGNETAGTLSTAGFPVDLAIISARNVAHWTNVFDRLRGPLKFLATQVMNTEASYNNSLTGFDNNTAIEIGNDSQNLGVNRNSQTYVDHLFKRAPGFFDVVSYDGSGLSQTINHNLEAVPELIIVKVRDSNDDWPIYNKVDGATDYMNLNTTAAASANSTRWNNTSPTSSVFTVGSDSSVNSSIRTFVAYLFASQPGVSKVGSYTGTGSNVDVDCGFTAGARFVMIKRTDDVGDWYYWDTARGIVSGNDPYLRFSSTDAETTNTDYIDPLNAGFTVTSSAPVALNGNGATYLFLAIA